MDDDGSPGLGIAFEIDTGGSFASLLQLEGAMDAAEQRILQDAERIERATSGMVKTGGAPAQLDAATVAVRTFGVAATRAERDYQREKRQTENAIERTIKTLDRETAALGRSREEQRAIRIEALQDASGQYGLREAANRMIEAETTNLQRRGAVAEWEAEKRAQAEAAINAQLMERARLEAAIEQSTGAGRMSAAQGGASFSALAERERGLELAERTTAEERKQLQLLGERAQIQSALERNTGLGGMAATDRGATFSALAAKAAEDEVRALHEASTAARIHAREHAELATVVRASAASMEADAAAAERLRVSTDPLYAVTSRLNAELAESTRLYHAGVIGSDEYGRQQAVLQQRMIQAAGAHDVATKAAGRNGFALTQLSFQVNDIVTMAAMGANPMMILASQGGQIVQVFQQAEGGAGAFGKQIGGLLLRFAPLGLAIGAIGVGLYALNQNMQDPALDEYAKTLGLTKEELKKLGDTSVTAGDMMSGLATTLGISFDGVGTTIKGWIVEIGNFFGNVVKGIGSATYGLFVGSYRAIVETWRQFPAALGDLFVQAVNGAIGTIERLANASIGAVNSLASGANSLLGMDLFGTIDDVQLARMENSFAGAGRSVGEAWGRNLEGATQEALNGVDGFVSRWTDNSRQAARDRLRARADELIGDRNDRKIKPDRHAESLAREAEAVEAQIRNLYNLAGAYRESGAAALVAEARVKAESDAIKKRADLEAMVERQIRLSIAQRVRDAAKSTAGVRDQVEAQRGVNAMVAAGIVPAERAAELVKDQIADLPLLAALQVAQQRGLTAEVRAATIALDEQRAMREQLRAAEQSSAFNSAMGEGAGRLADLRAEIGLIEASETLRTRQMATIRATRDAERLTNDPGERTRYIEQQVALAEEQLRLTQLQEDYNQALTQTVDLFDTLDQAAVDAARGMADAFGPVGGAIGEAVTVLTGYHAAEERLQQQRAARIEAAGNTERARLAENRLYAIRSASLQAGAFGDMANAAKGFFKEGTTGWQAMAAAEKAARAVEFALSVRAMVQDARETAVRLANGAARTAAKATEAVVNAIASLPFPANLVAGAATAAAIASLGVSVMGSFGGSGGRPESANEGRGTILGDPEAQSASIRRAIDSLKEVDTLMLATSREMLTSLRSIDRQIGGVASLVVRAGDVNADLGVREGFRSDTTGKLLEGIVTGGGLLSKIPIIGGIIGGIGSLVGSLFGSKTSVVGSGLYCGAQSVGSILGGGFDASYYSDIEKQKRFLGIKTGTSTSTQFTNADAGLEQQFTLLLRDFATAIGAAAGPLGLAADDVAARLNGTVITLGKIDFKGLTGAQIEEKLAAVFGAAADRMASGVFPGIERFQRVGEGAFETMVRVASTVEVVTASLDQLGGAARGLSLEAKLGLAEQFDSLGDLSSAVGGFFDRFYTLEEQAAAKAAQFGGVFASLGLGAPASLAAFRALVEAQDLTTAAGQRTYATLLELAPAFADLQAALHGTKSAADIAAERADLERKLLEVQGDREAVRALDLAKIDVSNRALQQQIWAIQDAQEAAKAADDLRKAWGDVGKQIEDEIRRIRGLSDPTGAGTFASLQGQFNAQSALARAGDQDAAKLLPGLSQSMLKAAGDVATSRQELERVQAQTAASLQATLAVVQRLSQAAAPEASAAKLLAAMETAPGAGSTAAAAANDDLRAELRAVKDELAGLRADNNAGHAATAGEAKRTNRTLDTLTEPHQGQALSVAGAAA